jgi:hypothetical protein
LVWNKNLILAFFKLEHLRHKKKCESMLDIMCKSKLSGITANKTKSKQNNDDIIESFDKTKSD